MLNPRDSGGTHDYRILGSKSTRRFRSVDSLTRNAAASRRRFDALAFEARVVGHDPARARARRDHGFGECRSRILRPVGDPLMMQTIRPPALHVRAELHGYLLQGGHLGSAGW